MPGTRRDQRHARLVGQTPPRVGHVHGGGFVPGVNERDVAPDGGVVDRQDLIAGEREEMPDAVSGQRVDEARGSGP